MKVVTITPFLLLTLLSICSRATATPDTASTTESHGKRGTVVRPFLESGFLVGSETETAEYLESSFRFHTELGLELRRTRSDGLPGGRVGIFGSVSPGRDDFRSAFGLRATYPLRPEYALQTALGPLFSTESNGTGLQARVGLMLPWHVSIVGMWQRLKLQPSGPEKERVVNSVYAGFMVHDTPGALTSAALWLVIIIYVGHEVGESASGWLN